MTLPDLVSCPKGTKLRNGPYKGQRSGHWWLCPEPDGKYAVSKCKRCKTTARFANGHSTDNPWRGYSNAPKRGAIAGSTPESLEIARETRKRNKRGEFKT